MPCVERDLDAPPRRRRRRRAPALSPAAGDRRRLASGAASPSMHDQDHVERHPTPARGGGLDARSRSRSPGSPRRTSARRPGRRRRVHVLEGRRGRTTTTTTCSGTSRAASCPARRARSETRLGSCPVGRRSRSTPARRRTARGRTCRPLADLGRDHGEALQPVDGVGDAPIDRHRGRAAGARCRTARRSRVSSRRRRPGSRRPAPLVDLRRGEHDLPVGSSRWTPRARCRRSPRSLGSVNWTS